MASESKLPANHIDITNKKSVIDINELDKDCELVLFELPQGFDRSLLHKMKIKNFKKDGASMELLEQYKGICFGNKNSITKQNLIMLTDSENKKVVFKPINRYVKLYECFDIPIPKEDSIKKRTLKYKRDKNKDK